MPLLDRMIATFHKSLRIPGRAMPVALPFNFRCSILIRNVNVVTGNDGFIPLYLLVIQCWPVV